MAECKTYISQQVNVPIRYKLIKTLGEGAYGTVFHVLDTKVPGQRVELAVKKVSRIHIKALLMRRAVRELRLMRFLRGHRNIVSLVDIHLVNEEMCAGLYCFQELMDWDFAYVLSSGTQFSEFHIQSFLYQILSGLKYTHSANIIHRDLKPGNMLVNRQGTLKIADFGLARGITAVPAAGSPITNYVATRWYRAPELLLREDRYGKEIDMWSVGCTLGEMYGRKPMMQGRDSVGQVAMIIDVLGPPPRRLLRARKWQIPVVPRIEHSDGEKIITKSGPRWLEMYPYASPAGLELIDLLLQWDPSARLTVEKALEHRFLARVRDPSGEPVAPGAFVFGHEEATENLEELYQMLVGEVNAFKREREVKRAWR